MKLHYKSLGQGEPLIILHGLFGMGDNWNSIARGLADDYQVILPDLRNHGRSGHTAEFDIPRCAEDILTLLDTLNIERAVIAGHSLGGKVAMYFALHYPQRCRSLLVFDIAPREYKRGHDHIFAAIQALDLEHTERRADIQAQLAANISDEGTVLFLLKNLARNTDGSGFHWKFNLESLYTNYNEITSALPGDLAYAGTAIFVRGENSNYIRDEDMDGIRKMFPAARFITVKNAGHWIHADQPEVVVGILNSVNVEG